jgi:hypothetical protein
MAACVGGLVGVVFEWGKDTDPLLPPRAFLPLVVCESVGAWSNAHGWSETAARPPRDNHTTLNIKQESRMPRVASMRSRREIRVWTSATQQARRQGGGGEWREESQASLCEPISAKKARMPSPFLWDGPQCCLFVWFGFV